jgi:hypothetical protein
MPNVQYRTPDDGQRSCLKHVEFYNRINFFLLLRLVGYSKSNPVPFVEDAGWGPEWSGECGNSLLYRD